MGGTLTFNVVTFYRSFYEEIFRVSGRILSLKYLYIYVYQLDHRNVTEWDFFLAKDAYDVTYTNIVNVGYLFDVFQQFWLAELTGWSVFVFVKIFISNYSICLFVHVVRTVAGEHFAVVPNYLKRSGIDCYSCIGNHSIELLLFYLHWL